MLPSPVLMFAGDPIERKDLSVFDDLTKKTGLVRIDHLNRFSGRIHIKVLLLSLNAPHRAAQNNLGQHSTLCLQCEIV